MADALAHSSVANSQPTFLSIEMNSIEANSTNILMLEEGISGLPLPLKRSRNRLLGASIEYTRYTGMNSNTNE